MRRRQGAILGLVALLVGLCPILLSAESALPDPYPDMARAYWLEVDGRPMWAGHPDAQLPPASLTKLMTALLVGERADLAATVTVSRAAARETGSRIGLRAAERVTAGDLLDAMLVRSANDACHALADWQDGSEPAFVARMNRRAAALGLTHTHFANACGHDAPTQYSSARDLARLAREAMRVPAIATAVARPRFSFAAADGRRHSMHSTNALLAGLRGTRGIKTGTTPEAGRCLVALVERDGVEVLLVLLHAPNRWWDSAGLIELAFQYAPVRSRDDARAH